MITYNFIVLHQNIHEIGQEPDIIQMRTVNKDQTAAHSIINAETLTLTKHNLISVQMSRTDYKNNKLENMESPG